MNAKALAGHLCQNFPHEVAHFSLCLKPLPGLSITMTMVALVSPSMFVMAMAILHLMMSMFTTHHAMVINYASLQ